MQRSATSGENLDQAFAEEQRKLDDVVRFITENHARIQKGMPARSAYQEAANEIQRVLQERQDSLDSALQQPYFGRLDFFVTAGPSVVTRTSEDDHEGGETAPSLQTVYLGMTVIQGQGVFSWTSPVARLWYTTSRQDGYTAPAGHVSALVDLKRYLRIRGQRLEGINDIFRRMPGPHASPNRVLTETLSQTGPEDGQLQVIVG